MKINYKIDAENKNFYIMENPKISGVVERRFPREYQCVPLSNDGFKIISLENQLQIYTGKISDHTIEGVEYTNAFEFCKELSNTIYVGTGGASEPLGAECETAVYTKDCDREALMTQLELHLAELVKIYGAVDGLELTTENIRIEAGQINLNTDEVENLLTELKNLIELKGSDCTNAVFVKDCGTQDLLDKLDEVIAALNANSQAEQALLTSIDTKLDELVLIKDELVTANTTLTGIKTDTAQINTNLEVVIEKLDLQVAALESLKVLVTDTNTKLDTANATLTTISTDIATIKTDIGLIKTDVSEIKTDVKTIINKLDAVVNSLTNIETKLDAVVTELQTINTTLQTEFDQTQAKLDEVKTSIEFAHDIFQLTDCEGNNIGAEQNVIKVVQLANQNVAICNVQELADAINSGAKDYTSVLNSIDTKASNLATILTELQTANLTLTGIKTDTTATNNKLDTLITKANETISELVAIKEKIEDGNLSLAELVTLTTNIDANITLIKNDVATIKADVSEIKDDVKLAVTALNNIEDLIENSNTLLQAIKDELDIELIVNKIEKNNGTINYIQRDTVQWDSENGIEIDTLTEYSVDGINWTATAPAGDVILGYIVPEPYVEIDLILGEAVEHCAVKTDGTKSQIFIRQNYTFDNKTEEKTALPLEYSTDKIVWTETAPVDTTFSFGACAVEAIAPQCIENVSYDLNGAKGIIFEASKLNSYDAQVIKGEMKFKEKNDVDFIEEVYNHSNGFSDDYKLLPNELKIVNKDANSRTIIKVLQVCGYMPIIADVIDETMVLLVSAIPKEDNTAIDVKFTDVPPNGSAGATGYRIKRYVKSVGISTALTLLDWTEGVANPLITNNGDGTYTYKDATAVVDVDYMYFYEAYNPISEGTSNEIEASLFSTSFIPTFRTTIANELVTLPMTTTAPVVIDWGDGVVETKSAPFTHTYAVAGDYDIEVKITASREVTNFRFALTGDRLKLIDIKNWGWVKLANAFNFWGCSNLEKITAEDTPKGLLNMNYFFASCSKLNQIDNFNWDTTLVTEMAYMFENCTIFNLPVNQLNTSNVTNIAAMFSGARAFNQSVSNFNTSKVTNMSSMFANAIAFNQSVSNFDTSKVTTMERMFNGAYVFNQPVPFNTSLVTSMNRMFASALVFNQDVNFNTANVTNMSNMFNGASAFNKPVPFNTANVTLMDFMFTSALVFNQDVNFNTANVTNIAAMFSGARAFNQSVSNFNTSKVTNMSSMFANAIAFNQSVSNFDTANVTNMSNMFNGASAFNKPVPFNTSLVTSMNRMFASALVFNQDVNFNTANVTNMSNMFNGASAFNKPVPFNTANVTLMDFMFTSAIAFNQAITFNIPLVTNLTNFVNGSALSTTNMDNVLIHFASQTTQNNVPMTNNRPRTSASDSARATLISRGWTGL